MTKKKRPTEHKFRGVTMPTSSHPVIRQARRNGAKPTIHGNKLWKSSRLIIDYLKKNPPEHCERVLDVGCGWGISGIWCAKTLGAKVTSMDADPDVFPFLEATASLNGVKTRQLVARFEDLDVEALSKYDLIVGADICFWDEMIKPLNKMINRATKGGVKQIIVADPGREPFFNLASKCVKKHYAEVMDWETKPPVKARGELLIINNA